MLNVKRVYNEKRNIGLREIKKYRTIGHHASCLEIFTIIKFFLRLSNPQKRKCFMQFLHEYVIVEESNEGLLYSSGSRRGGYAPMGGNSIF